MALTATMFHVVVAVSDVDRGVYETLDLRLARHPSETMRYLMTRLLAYCLSYEEGITFSRGGLSSAEEPPVAIVDPTGTLLAHIDVGAPSADRLHKASKAARRVAVFTHDLAALRREAATRAIHKAEAIEVFHITTALLDELEPLLGRNTKLEVVRTDGELYITVDGKSLSGPLTSHSLTEDPPA
jgi:uncharacterized protein YaeQ